MQRTRSLDARDGLLWLLVNASGEIVADATIWWEVPGGTNNYAFSTTSVVLNEVNRIPAWDGPTLGRVGVELLFTNAGPA